jgi:hypothetical protein
MGDSQHISNKVSETLDKIVETPWEKAYWILRLLINSEYGGIGSDNKIMTRLASVLKTLIDEFYDSSVIIDTAKNTVKECIIGNTSCNTKKYDQLLELIKILFSFIESPIDIKVFYITVRDILIPTNKSISDIPSDDKVFSESIVKGILKTKGEKGLENIINIWDKIGAKGCMQVERIEIVESFNILRQELEKSLPVKEQNILLTAFCQEFERRLGQKRKGRAGRSVEDVTGLILDYFGFKSSSGPEHFTTSLEIDKWVKTKRGWFIGISCKRTLRERWKQAHTTNLSVLNRHKILVLIHLLTFDRDLSDAKLTEMGSYRARFYLPDNSPQLNLILNHPGTKNYAHPMSCFINDLKLAIEGENVWDL